MANLSRADYFDLWSVLYNFYMVISFSLPARVDSKIADDGSNGITFYGSSRIPICNEKKHR